MELRVAADDDWDAICDADGRAFGHTHPPAMRAANRPTIDLSRFRIVVDGASIVGVAGSYAFDVALPGGAAVPMGGVTWVSVATTHRRRGILTQLMAAVHDDIDAHGEPVASLYASQSSIYERFGYGAATQRRGVRLATAGLQLHERWRERAAAAGPVRILDHDAADTHIEALWDRWWRTRAGEVQRGAAHRALLADRRREIDGGTDAIVLAHDDGYAIYRIDPHWNEGFPAHELRVTELVACTRDAHAALWKVLIGTDLVGTIVSRQLPADDTVPLLLADPRAFNTVHLADGVWVHVRDVAVAFSARRYAVEDSLVLEVAGRRWRIEGGPEGADVRAVRSRPDLVADAAALGPLLYGGVRATWLAGGGRIDGSPNALARADALFDWAPAPHCQTAY
jgi:predicted acetyltransferase